VKEIWDHGSLCHLVLRAKEVPEGRLDITTPTVTLQVATMRYGINKAIHAHKHLPCERRSTTTTEAIIVMRGAIEVDFYGLQDQHLATEHLATGDCCVFILGGHAVKFAVPDTLIYEIKSGPYMGREKDKENIEG
jgi:hypothetical protein